MIYSFMYVFVFSFSAVLIQKLYFNISPLFSLLISASIATIVFNIINIRKLKETYRKLWSQKAACVGIMVTILVMWNCTMIAPGLIGASVSTFIYFAWLGMLGLLISGMDDRLKLYAGLFVLLLIALVIGINISHEFSRNILFGIILSIIGGTSSYVYFKQSQSLINKTQLSAIQILSFRFLLTIIALFAVLPKGSFFIYSTWENYLELTLLAITGLIVPLFFMQKALEKISSEQNAIIISLTPVFISFLQEFIFKDVNFKYIVIYLLYTLAISSPYILKNMQRGLCKS